MSENETIDLKKANEIIGKITGPDGLLKVYNTLSQTINAKTIEKAKIEAEINAYKQFQTLLKSLAVHWGVADLGEGISVTTGQTNLKEVTKKIQQADLKVQKQLETQIENTEVEVEDKEPELDPEVKERLLKNKCIYRHRKEDGSKRWCARKLKTAKDKKCGYCPTHQRELGLE